MKNLMKMSRLAPLLVSVAVFGLASCTQDGTTPSVDGPDQPIDPPSGETDFVSADGNAGQRAEQNDDETAAAGDFDADGASERSVEEGDIYRVLDNDLILNLNAYRGLQIIDFSDVTSPEVIGRVRVSGSPVELYTVGTRAYVLLNNWSAYYGSRDDIQVERVSGGLLMVVNIADPESPVVTGQARVPGWIRTSRLTRGDGGEALYVVSNDWEGDSQTRVRSFGLSSEGKLIERSAIDLGGYVQDIQATPDALLVARNDWSNDRGHTTVALVDISNPDGTMVEGASVRLEGMINNKTNMDLHRGILRAASGNSWGNNGNTNHLETFDVSDMDNPTRVDHDTYGDGENLFATLFLGNKAFFVTYRRVDPFHAFEIDDDGNATEMSEYVISGWNDYFRPVFDEHRIIGIGMDDDGGRTMAVSLYDITDLENPEPFITRAHVEANYSWSEARWDDRAFSVLEDAVEVVEGDVIETGLVLLPFSGYLEDEGRYVSAVQIFTFSDSTLTSRGVMRHGTPVRRSFLGDEDTTVNLSEAELSLFDHTDPDNPEELGRVDLAPNVEDFFVFGEYGVRFHSNSGWYWWYSDGNTGPDEFEVIPLSDDPDLARPLAEIQVPARSKAYQVGDLLVTVSMQTTHEDGETTYESLIQVHDLSDPTSPVLAGTLETDRLRPSYGGYYWGDGDSIDCFDCGWGWGGARPEAAAAGDALVFVERENLNELLGHETTCNYWPTDRGRYDCWDEEGEGTACAWYDGNTSCSSLDGGDEVCVGGFQQCESDPDGEYTCEAVDLDDVPTESNCWERDRYHYWQQFALSALDLSDPTNPILNARISLPRSEEASSYVADGETLFLNHHEPADVEADSRSFVRYFTRPIDFSNPARPVLNNPINVPGEVIEVEGSTLITRDYQWGDDIVETALNRLILFEGRAYLQASRQFVDEVVQNVVLDGDNILITKQISYRIARLDPNFDWEDWRTDLTIMSLEGDDFPILSETEVDRWANLRDARLGRALFQVSGGLLVLNTSNPASPFAQAYFPTTGWPTRIVGHDRDIYLAAGRYGMYRFGLDSFNLLTTPL